MPDAKPVLIASDVHLGSAPPQQEEAFMAWLGLAAERASWIILNGDLFDFWFEYVWGTTRGHDRILDKLRATVAAGVRVTLMGGNHDWWGGRHLRETVGVEFLRDPVVRDIAGHRTLLAHGDGLGRGDLGYRLLRTVLRSGMTRGAFALLPPRLGDWVARRVSRTDRKWETWTERHRERAEALGAWAAAELHRNKELELVVLGHTHLPVAREVAVGRWYVNTGDWVVHRTYLSLTESRPPRLVAWEGGAL